MKWYWLNYALLFLLNVPLVSYGESFRGWEYLVDKLREDRVSIQTLRAIYGEKVGSFPDFQFVSFKLKPKEPFDIYLGFRSAKKIAAAREFLNDNYSLLQKAERRYGVPKEIIVAILLVETHFGKNTGKEQILYRLSRLANINSPKNVWQNYLALKREDSAVTLAAVKKRAKYLEDTFYPEVLATFKIASINRFSPLSLIGSSAGAFGWPQFLPTSYLRFGSDGNGDGRVSLFNKSDAIFSIARYFQAHGWRKNLTRTKQEEVIWAYNKSDPYINTVLYIYRALKT
jgi:membrane-bound lytic murein transglycosylase B